MISRLIRYILLALLLSTAALQPAAAQSLGRPSYASVTTGTLTVGGLAYLPPVSKTGIIVPFYIFANNPYSNTVLQRLLGLIRQYHDVPVIVIVNSANGPGVYDLVWADTIKLLKGAGATVVGYVDTAFGARAIADVETDIIAWNSIYAATPVDGIFFDERAFDPSFIPYYQALYKYVHANGYSMVIENPGSDSGGDWYSTVTAEITVLWENGTWPTEAGVAGNFVGGHTDFPVNDNAVLVYGQSSFDLYTYRRIRRYVKWIYVTNDVLTPNPWDSLPSYLEQEFAAAADVNVPGNGVTNLTFGASIAWDAGETRTALVTLTGNAALAAPANLVDGASYTLIVQQDATGNRQLTFDAIYAFTSGVTLPLTTTANRKYVITFSYHTTLNATSVSLY